MFEKYGFDRKNDPDYWVRTARAIGDDGSLSEEQKMAAWNELTTQYQTEKRDKSARNAKHANPESNQDTENAAILQAELANLKLNLKEHADPQRQAKIKNRIAEIEKKLATNPKGGNPNTQKR